MVTIRERTFIYAVLISLAWHLFWLSIVRVIVTPGPGAPIKFSQVSFLGPILAKGSMQLRVEPKSRSYLERRYMSALGKADYPAEASSGLKYGPLDNSAVFNEDLMPGLIDEAVSGQKLEPD